MIDITTETRIARPVHDVFAYATDPGKLSSWLGGPGRIIEPLVARVLRKQFAQHLATLKQVLEGAAVTA